MDKICNDKRKGFISAEIGKKIYDLRKLKKLSREQLAEKSNLSTTYIFDIENGKSMPSCLTIIDICNALDISSSEILDDFLSNSNVNSDESWLKNFYALSKKEKASVINLISFMANEFLE